MDRQGSADRVAAVVFTRGTEVHALLAALVDGLRAQGLTIGGLVQRHGAALPGGRRAVLVEDLGSGRHRRLDTPRGPEAVGCTLDSEALSHAAVDLRAAIAARPDLLVVNRFGCSEAEGGGLRAEIAEAICAGIPLLIAVRDDYLPAWEAFLGGPPC